MPELSCGQVELPKLHVSISAVVQFLEKNISEKLDAVFGLWKTKSSCKAENQAIKADTQAIKVETKALKGTVKQLQSSCALLKSCLNPTHAPFYFIFSNVQHYYARRS